MSGMNSDQLYRSTLDVYSNLTDEFNPSLQKLVSLGNSYVQAFQALAETSEAYFSVLSRVGERAFHTVSSRSIGDVLIQIAESQRRLTMELEGIFRWYGVEVLQEMANNIRLDKDYIASSRRHYEMEVQNQAAALDRQLRRGASQDCSEYVQFLRESHSEILKEEERRHRFLAEKHCGLVQSIADLMNNTGGSLKQRANAWTHKVNATRTPNARQPSTVDNSIGMREEDFQQYRDEQTLGDIPSRAPSPQGSLYRPAGDSGGGGGGNGGGRSMRALAAHQPEGSNSTMLTFTKGEMITVVVQKPRNGWLYGRTDGSSRPGWFPASYVEALDDPQMTPISSSSSLRNPSSTSRSNSSVSNYLDQSGGSNQGGAPPPPPPPPPSSYTAEKQPITPTPNKRAESRSENKRSKPHGSAPELFPRGTNPFATVKLKPTHTDDRSGPRVNRR